MPWKGPRELKAEFFHDLPNGNKELIISPEGGGGLVLTLSLQAVPFKRRRQNSSKQNMRSLSTAALDISLHKTTLRLRGQQDVAICFRTDFAVANPIVLQTDQTAEKNDHTSSSEWENNSSLSLPGVLH